MVAFLEPAERESCVQACKKPHKPFQSNRAHSLRKIVSDESRNHRHPVNLSTQVTEVCFSFSFSNTLSTLFFGVSIEAIALDRLTKRFGPVTAVDGISLSI